MIDTIDDPIEFTPIMRGIRRGRRRRSHRRFVENIRETTSASEPEYVEIPHKIPMAHSVLQGEELGIPTSRDRLDYQHGGTVVST